MTYPQPVIFLHGGPGAGTSPNNRRFFDPDFYRIILVDQRGAGKSIPHASLVDNTTWHLVEDLEKLREILKIDKWLVGYFSMFLTSWTVDEDRAADCRARFKRVSVVSIEWRGDQVLKRSVMRRSVWSETQCKRKV